MAPLATPFAIAGPCGAVSVSAVTSVWTRAGRRRGPTGPKCGRPGDRERGRLRRVPSQLLSADAPGAGQRPVARPCMSGANPCGALCAPLKP